MEHKLISLADARPGMRIVADVCGPTGGDVLLAAGAVLSGATLSALARRGIGQLVVVEPLSPEERAARIAAIDQRLDVLFRHAGNDPLLRKLRGAVREYRVEKL